MPPDYTPDLSPSLSDRCWQQAMAQLSQALQARCVHPAEAVVLLPYAQLIQQARLAWAAQAGDTFFVPRFETTMNWASSLGGTLGLYTPSGDDLRMDVAVDMLTAASLLGRAGLASQQDVLAGRLVDAAWSLGRVAAAVRPAERQAWSERLDLLDQQAARFDARFRQGLFVQVRERQLNGQQASSLMNDLGYASRITQSLRNVLLLGQGDGNELLRPLRKMLAEDGPLIQMG
jgi:hypothetical protein